VSTICTLFLSVPLSAVRPVRILCWIPIIVAAVCPIALAAEALARVKTIAAGAEHTIALTEDGQVLAWGANWAGQLGDGATVLQSTPVPVRGPDGPGRLEGIVAIAAGTEHSVALRDDGTVWAWGGNRYGQLGDGTTEERNRPVQVRGKAGEGHLEGVTAIAAGVGHTVALKDAGTVWVLGRSDLHEWDESNCFPRQVKTRAGEYLTDITAIAAGEEHTVALREDGTVWAWGINWEGTLGDGTQTRTSDAVQAQIAGCRAIAAGGRATFALREDETIGFVMVWAWGDNYAGQLGEGRTAPHKITPVQVKGEEGDGVLTEVRALAAGMGHTAALKKDGTVWAWGSGTRGRIGDGDTAARYTPVQVKGTGGEGFLAGVTALAAGEGHTVGLTGDGTLVAWGVNSSGQLGDGTTRDRTVPVRVKGEGAMPEPAAAADGDAEPIRIGSRLELFVDRHLIDALDGAEWRLHTPQKMPLPKSPVIPANTGDGHYATVIKDNDVYRAYYRESSYRYAESSDGIEWTRRETPLLGSHNFSPFLDTNPDADPQERFKALDGLGTPWSSGLAAWASPDGVQWEWLQSAVITGAPFDSQNVAFWSEAENMYVCYFRNYRRGVRTIWRVTSRDFLNWSDPEELHPNLPGEHFYTNQTHPYFRAPHIYIALPARFAETDEGNVGTGDIMFMTSRGGAPYERLFKESFIRPGLDLARWASRGNYTALNVVPTGPDEISIYHRSGHRYVLRTDGFVSVRAPWEGGEMITKPLIFEGQELVLNLSTSIRGGVRVELQTADGQPLPGRALDDCPPILGDSIEHVVSWRGGSDVSEHGGQPVRIRFVLQDADVYSLRFR
jgi:alpha-tubulin suppressor-like RCC1 family protein